MTLEETSKLLNAYILCQSKQGRCNCGDECDDNCNLLYEQGTVGEHNEAICKAIRSLEAWEKVKAEIVERKKHLDEHDKEDMRELAGILSILASITEHLQEVTTDADSD